MHDIEREIVDAVKALPQRMDEESRGSDSRWTAELMGTLGELGRKHGFDVCTSKWGRRDGHCWPEWLYDLTWLQMEDHHIINVPLILESEWLLSLDHIQPDFEKLLLGRAEHRVMVFQQKDQAAVAEVIEYLKGCIDRFKAGAPGDRYLFLGYDISAGSFRSDLHVAPEIR